MKSVFLLVILGSVFSARAETKWLTPDFAVSVQKDEMKRPFGEVPSTSCRDQIAKILCLVDPPTDNQGPQDRVCLPGGEQYAPIIESVYDRMPVRLQTMFCHLQKIWIEKEFMATAFANSITDANGKVLGGAVGIRKDFVDQLFTIDQWSTWKEQLNFGGDPSSYKSRADLPLIHSSDPDMLYFVLAHEFGHLIDFTNQVNGFDDCHFEDGHLKGTCAARPGTWSALSWKSSRGQVLDEYEFPMRKFLCFYWCGGQYIDPAHAFDLYRGLFMSNFISIYAASNPWEDFAETIAYQSLQDDLKGSYEIRLNEGVNFDSMVHLSSPVMASKMSYVNDLFQRGIKYPGE